MSAKHFFLRSFSCLLTLAIAFHFTACVPWSARKHVEMQTLAQKRDENGIVVEAITQTHEYGTMSTLISPEGPGTASFSHSLTFYLEDSHGKSLLSFLREDDRHFYPYEFLPVAHSPYWIATKSSRSNPHGHDLVSLVVFDRRDIVHKRTFDVLWRGRIKSDDGNRTLLFEGEQGIQRYDVLSDTLELEGTKK